jgi:predicted xylose isomerase-like sugar epimerase
MANEKVKRNTSSCRVKSGAQRLGVSVNEIEARRRKSTWQRRLERDAGKMYE